MTINRSKQQAIAFLLGALLVGGVLGFSADRVLSRPQRDHGWRSAMYKELSLTQAQRSAIDSLLDRQQCDMRRIMKPVRPQLDSLRLSGRRQIIDLLTPEQRQRFEARLRDEEAKAGTRRNPRWETESMEL